MPMTQIAEKLESGISSLVETMAGLPYFETYSSCEGHFDFNNDRGYLETEFAHVTSRLQNGWTEKDAEAQLEQMLSYVLPRCIALQSSSAVLFRKGYYKLADDQPLQKEYTFQIEPIFWQNLNPFDRRKATDDGINALEQALSEYLSR